MEIISNITSPITESLTQLIGIEVTPIMLLVTLLVIILGASFLRSKGKATAKKGKDVLLLGCCDVGKTALYRRLRDGSFKEHSTVTSQEKLDATFPFAKAATPTPRHIIDYPGHDRLRPGVERLLPSAGVIVFLLDSFGTVESRSIVHAADFLYQIFTNPHVNDLKIPVYIACNKSDMFNAAEPSTLKSSLEKELDSIRASQNAIPGKRENDQEVYLGIEGEKFKMEHLPFEVEFEALSVKEGTGYSELVQAIDRYLK